MGMFDTFHIQDRGRELAVQSKRFACLLDDYRIGDFVSFDHGTPTGITAWVEDHKHDWRDPTCPVEWAVILLVDGCFLDAYVADSEADARQAATVLVKLWQAPERQAEALKRHAREHYDARMRYRGALGEISALLSDYADLERQKTEGQDTTERRFAFMRHDFEAESWDWHLARLLSRLEEFREAMPAKYAVPVELDNVSGGHQP